MIFSIIYKTQDQSTAQALATLLHRVWPKDDTLITIRFNPDTSPAPLHLTDLWSDWFSNYRPSSNAAFIILTEATISTRWITWGQQADTLALEPQVNQSAPDARGRGAYLGRKQGIFQANRQYWPFIYLLDPHQYPTPDHLATLMRCPLSDELQLLLSRLTRLPLMHPYPCPPACVQEAIDEYIATVYQGLQTPLNTRH